MVLPAPIEGKRGPVAVGTRPLSDACERGSELGSRATGGTVIAQGGQRRESEGRSTTPKMDGECWEARERGRLGRHCESYKG